MYLTDVFTCDSVIGIELYSGRINPIVYLQSHLQPEIEITISQKESKYEVVSQKKSHYILCFSITGITSAHQEKDGFV